MVPFCMCCVRYENFKYNSYLLVLRKHLLENILFSGDIFLNCHNNLMKKVLKEGDQNCQCKKERSPVLESQIFMMYAYTYLGHQLINLLKKWVKVCFLYLMYDHKNSLTEA